MAEMYAALEAKEKQESRVSARKDRRGSVPSVDVSGSSPNVGDSESSVEKIVSHHWERYEGTYAHSPKPLKIVSHH